MLHLFTSLAVRHKYIVTSKGGLTSILYVIHQHRYDTSILIQALQLIELLITNHSENRNACVDADGIERIVTVMKLHTANTFVLHACICVLTQLCINAPTHETALAHTSSAVEQCLSILYNHPTSHTTHPLVANLVLKLALNPLARAYISHDQQVIGQVIQGM